MIISSKKYKITMIKTQTYSIKNLILTSEVLELYINNFWNDIFTPIQENKHLMLICKVEFNESELGYRSLGHLRRVNFTDKELFIEYIIARLGVLTDSYVTEPISKITFTYIIKSGLVLDNKKSFFELDSKSSTTHRFNNMNLPITMNPEEYGEVIVNNFVQTKGGSFNRFVVENGNRSYIIDVSTDGLVNNVRIQGAIDLSWIDTKITSEAPEVAGSLLFKRDIGKSSIYFLDGIRILRKKTLKFKPFLNESTNKTLDSNFITMDIETIKINSKLPHLKIFPF